MAVLRGAYPNYYKGASQKDLLAVVALWQEMFENDDYETVAHAVKRLIALDEKGFPPVIGQIKEQMDKLIASNRLSANDAWILARRAVRHDLTEACRLFDALPCEVRAVVGRPSVLCEWALCDDKTLSSVVASNFMRAYRENEQFTKEERKLPKALQNASQKQLRGQGNLIEGGNA